MGELPNFGNVEPEDSTSEGWDKVTATPTPEKPKATKEGLPDFGNAKPELSDSEGWDKVTATPPEDVAAIEAQTAADKAALDKAEAAVASTPDSTQTPEEAAAAGKLAESSEALSDALTPDKPAPVLAPGEGAVVVPPALKEEAEANKAAIATGDQGKIRGISGWIAKNAPWLSAALTVIGLGAMFATADRKKVGEPWRDSNGAPTVTTQKAEISKTAEATDITRKVEEGWKPDAGFIDFLHLQIGSKETFYQTDEFIRMYFEWAQHYSKNSMNEIKPMNETDMATIMQRLKDNNITGFTIPSAYGTTSPEATMGQTNKENDQLSEDRAKGTVELTMKEGAKAGIDVEQKVGHIDNIEFDNIQKQIDGIQKIADEKYDGDAMAVIRDWNRENRDKFTAEDKTLLNDVFEKNRKGGDMIRIQYGEKDEFIVAPLWLLLPLLPIPFALLKKKKEEEDKKWDGSGVKPIPEEYSPIPVVEEDSGGKKVTGVIPPIPYLKISEGETPVDSTTPPAETVKPEDKKPLVEVPTFATIDTTPKPEMYGVALREDLSEHWAKHPDIPYEDMTDEMIDNFKLDGSDNKAALTYLSARILDAWQKHDTQARKDKQDEIDNKTSLDDYGGFKELGAVDYSKDEEQMGWAKAHASVLLELAKSIKALPENERLNVDYLQYLKDHQDEILSKASSAK